MSHRCRDSTPDWDVMRSVVTVILLLRTFSHFEIANTAGSATPTATSGLAKRIAPATKAAATRAQRKNAPKFSHWDGEPFQTGASEEEAMGGKLRQEVENRNERRTLNGERRT